MTKRRAIIIIFAVILILLMGYSIVGTEETVQVMKEENLTIVEAPDQIESTEHPDFVKAEYVPVALEGTNVALEGKIEADSFSAGYPANKAIDGKTEGASYWEGGADAYPNILTLDLKEEKSIHAIRLCVCPQSIWGKRTQTFAVFTGTDEENLTEFITEKEYIFDPDTGNEIVLEFDSVNTQFVRLVFTGNTGAHGGQVAEFEVYTK